MHSHRHRQYMYTCTCTLLLICSVFLLQVVCAGHHGHPTLLISIATMLHTYVKAYHSLLKFYCSGLGTHTILCVARLCLVVLDIYVCI